VLHDPDNRSTIQTIQPREEEVRRQRLDWRWRGNTYVFMCLQSRGLFAGWVSGSSRQRQRDLHVRTVVEEKTAGMTQSYPQHSCGCPGTLLLLLLLPSLWEAVTYVVAEPEHQPASAIAPPSFPLLFNTVATAESHTWFRQRKTLRRPWHSSWRLEGRSCC